MLHVLTPQSSLLSWSALAALALALAACGSSESTESGAPAALDPTSGSGATSSGANGSSGSTETDAGLDAAPVLKAVRFVAMGDTGTGENGQVKIANAVAAKCKKDGCDFVQLLGDNLYESGASSVDDAIWDRAFEIPYSAIDLDFFAVLGNHDYGGNGAGTEFGKGKNEVDYTKKSKKWKMPAAHFHFVKDNVEFFALDTTMAMFSRAEQQKNDVNEWLADSTADWKIAVGHHPYKSNGPHGNAGRYDGLPLVPVVNGSAVKSFLEATVCGKADVYFSGHDHSQQWLNESCAGTELAVSGAGAKATELNGQNPALFQSLELGFLYVVIQGKKLTAEFIDENGNIEFSHVTSKP